MLADVRSTPYSRFNPQYNKKALEQALIACGIQYQYFGDRLGGRPRDPSCYKHHIIPAKAAEYAGEIMYAEVMKREWFVEGIQELIGLASTRHTCIMCSEKDPVNCHRHHLIARYLTSHYPDVTVLHILSDGSLVDARSIKGDGDHIETEQLAF